MNFNLLTLTLVLGLVSVLEAIAIYIQYLISKNYRGIGWWVLGFTSAAIGFLLLLLQDIVSSKWISIFFPNTLLLLGSMLIYIGIMRFLDKKENRGIILSILAVFMVLFFYFTFVDNDIAIRTLLIAAAQTPVALLTARGLWVNRTPFITGSVKFLIGIFLFQSGFLLFRIVEFFFSEPINAIFNPTMMQTAVFLIALIVGLLLTFGLIILINQRLNSEVKEAKEHIELIFNTSPEVFLIARLSDGMIVNINEEFSTATGFARDEIVGKPIMDIPIWKNPADRQRVLDELDEKGFCENFEAVLQRKDLSQNICMISAKTIPIKGIPHIITTTRDITRRKQAEEELRASEEHYRILFDEAMDGICIADAETGIIIDCNRALAALVGRERAGLIGQPQKVLHPSQDDQETVSSTFKQHLTDKQGQILETQVVTRQGNIREVEIKANFLNIRGRKLLQGIFRDITKRKQLEEIIRQSEERYRTVIEEIDEGYYEVDLAGNFTFVNDSVIRQLQYSREELIGMNYRTYILQDELEGVYKAYNRVYRSGEIIKWFPMTNIRKDGTPLFVEDSISCLRDKGGRIIGFRGISLDITERNKAEKKLNQTMENLRKAMGGIIQVISGIVETRDPYTAGHQRRVADLARAIAGEMGLADDQRDGLRMAGNIHDLGKVSIPAEILSKPTQLTEIENQLIQAHSQIGYDILKGIEFPWPIADIVLQHHERVNGSGYPRGIKGEAISLEARILMVADVVEAMASYRPYRPGLGIDAALEEIEKNKGILYDPEVAEVCLRLFREKGFGFK